jgi:hypothetical protein
VVSTGYKGIVYSIVIDLYYFIVYIEGEPCHNGKAVAL